MTYENPVILALYPNSVGIGYACIQIPEHLFDFGVTTAKPMSNGKLLRRAEKFMDYYRPQIVLVKEVGGTKNSSRTNRLIEAITTLSGEKDLQVYRYTKQQIKDVFEVFGAVTSFEIAERIIRMFPDMKHRAPQARKWYEKEDYNMVVFHAVALAITHQYLTE